MGNLDLYNKYKEVPKEAQKPIGGGRLKGMTDINPMWRIKCLTEEFGPCGQGWYYTIIDSQLVGGADEQAVIITINLFVKYGDEWSLGIMGIGGSKIVSKDKNGLYLDDEAYKKATTDALSVACKQLGIGAAVYWKSDRDKYTAQEEPKEVQQPNLEDKITQNEVLNLMQLLNEQNAALVKSTYKIEAYADLTYRQYYNILNNLKRRHESNS